ncbi:MAG: thioesterase [Paludibacter sp.]|nr:thioesterase [Paludibacter sp.]
MDNETEQENQGGKQAYNFQIQPQTVDFQYRVTMAAFVDILLTAAGYNADHNGFGIRKLNEINSSWVLLRLAVELDRFPLQYEDIIVETWIEEVGRAMTSRNFCIKDKDGKIMGYAASNWAMIDLDTRHAKDLYLLEGIREFTSGISAPIKKPIKLKSVDSEPFDVFKVKYSDIDINGHTSSMRYIEWVSDYFSLDDYRKKQVSRFEINYVNEMLFGDEVSIFANEYEPDDFRFEIRKNGTTSSRARIVFC